MGATYTVTANFGTGGTRVNTLIVSQADVNVLSTSYCEAWIQGGDSTADNGSQAHALAAAGVACVCTPVNGVGLSVELIALIKLTKSFLIRLVWS